MHGQRAILSNMQLHLRGLLKGRSAQGITLSTYPHAQGLPITYLVTQGSTYLPRVQHTYFLGYLSSYLGSQPICLFQLSPYLLTYLPTRLPKFEKCYFNLETFIFSKFYFNNEKVLITFRKFYFENFYLVLEIYIYIYLETLILIWKLLLQNSILILDFFKILNFFLLLEICMLFLESCVLYLDFTAILIWDILFYF